MKFLSSLFDAFIGFAVGKQAMNPEHEARGALNAGYAFHSMSKVQVIGYRYLDDPAFKAEQMALFESQPSMRKDMNILDDAEVKALVTQKIRQIPQDIQVMYTVNLKRSSPFQMKILLHFTRLFSTIFVALHVVRKETVGYYLSIVTWSQKTSIREPLLRYIPKVRT